MDMMISSEETEKLAEGSPATVGILYPGELGSTLGRLLARSGLAVVTTVEGRSERTRRLAEEAGLSLVRGIREVAEQADIVLSTVSPAAALPVAQHFLLSRPLSPLPPTPEGGEGRVRGAARRQLYVDLNSTSVEIACQLEKLFRPMQIDFVDGAIHGLASRLPERGTLYLSGDAAPRLAQLFDQALRVKVLGREAGQASTFKMMISGLAKGVVALFVEMSLAGHRAGLLDDLLACYRQAYPGIVELVERLLPTYAQHATRRAEEAREVEQTVLALGLRPCLTAGARVWAEELARADFSARTRQKEANSDALLEMIEALAACGILEMPADEQRPEALFPSPGRREEAANVLSSPASLA